MGVGCLVLTPDVPDCGGQAGRGALRREDPRERLGPRALRGSIRAARRGRHAGRAGDQQAGLRRNPLVVTGAAAEAVAGARIIGQVEPGGVLSRAGSEHMSLPRRRGMRRGTRPSVATCTGTRFSCGARFPQRPRCADRVRGWRACSRYWGSTGWSHPRERPTHRVGRAGAVRAVTSLPGSGHRLRVRCRTGESRHHGDRLHLRVRPVWVVVCEAESVELDLPVVAADSVSGRILVGAAVKASQEDAVVAAPTRSPSYPFVPDPPATTRCHGDLSDRDPAPGVPYSVMGSAEGYEAASERAEGSPREPRSRDLRLEDLEPAWLLEVLVVDRATGKPIHEARAHGVRADEAGRGRIGPLRGDLSSSVCADGSSEPTSRSMRTGAVRRSGADPAGDREPDTQHQSPACPGAGRLTGRRRGRVPRSTRSQEEQWRFRPQEHRRAASCSTSSTRRAASRRSS